MKEGDRVDKTNSGEESTDTGRTEQSSVQSKLRTATIAFGLGILGYFSTIIWTIPFREAHELYSITPTYSTNIMINLLSIVLGAITFGAIVFHYSDKDIEYIDLSIPDRRDRIIIVLGTVALLLSIYLMSIVTSVFETTSSEHTMRVASRGVINPNFALMLVPLSFLAIAPAEEFIFRNVVQKWLYSDFTKIGAVFLASVVFTLVHIPAYATGTVAQLLLSLLHVMMLSVILGSAYAWSENLMMPILLHGAYNAAIYLEWYLQLAFGMRIW